MAYEDIINYSNMNENDDVKLFYYPGIKVINMFV